MHELEISPRLDAAARGQRAEAMLASAFEDAGWHVRPQPDRSGPHRPDMVVRRGRAAYAVELKAAAEGRSDRLIPLWSQAYLQALRVAGNDHPPLAVVAAPRIAPRVAEQILSFAAEYAPGAAAGVIDFAGLRRFRGDHLEDLDSRDDRRSRSARPARPTHGVHGAPADIFSDLNQWMLKVLLAPDIAPHLLSAPRAHYRDATHLAKSAGASAMSASRLVRQLQHGGYLDESKPYLALVRREELFRRWQAASDRPVREVPMKFLLRGDPAAELRAILKKGQACLALFAAADALKLGFVHGVPPYVYVPRLEPDALGRWKNLVPAERGEVPDVIVRQAPAVRSVFRGVVVGAHGAPSSDVLQVWLDVSSHPSRGEEQADLIRRRVLDRIIAAEHDRDE